LRLSLRGGILGGKGGFGSLLRSQRSTKKTTNFGSCRDISGRRLRDIDQEKRLADYYERQANGTLTEEEERLREERELREAVQAEQRRKRDLEREKKAEELNNKRKEVVEDVMAALSAGLAKLKEAENENRGIKRKKSDEPVDKFWYENSSLDKMREEMGLSADSDDDSEEQDSDGEQEPKTKKARLDPEISSKEEAKSEPKVTKTTENIKGQSTLKTSEPTTENSAKTKEKNNTRSVTKTIHVPVRFAQSVPTNKEVKKQEPSKNEEKTQPNEITSKTTTQTSKPELINLSQYSTAKDLEALGMNTLKNGLEDLGLKCGGTLTQRAERLWATKGLTKEQYDPTSLAPKKKK